jgi:LacI family transcriptional regulator
VTTIGDVARKAGVSPATVSRVLNGTATVSAERAERVRQAAEALRYQPSGPARALRRQRTTLWAAIVADIENPFFTSMLRGVEDIAQRENHRLVLCNSDEDVDKEAAYIDVAIADRMAGVIIAVASTGKSSLEPLVEAGIPVVAVDRRPRSSAIDSVLVDNRLGARQATDHLLDGGARRVGCITGPARLSNAETRLAGYRDALEGRGLPEDGDLVRRADFREEGGHRAACSLLDGPRPPDAIFVTNNLMTLGALRALRERGCRVPDDVTLVGFDDAPWTSLVTPPLSVVAQPTAEIGRQAAELLATAGTGRPARHVVLAPTLVVRESSRHR